MKTKKLLYIIFFALFSCYKTEQTLNNHLLCFVGKTEGELIYYFGTADELHEDDDNRYISLVYVKKNNVNLLNSVDVFRNGCIFTFFINKQTLLIDKYQYKGLKCYGLKPVSVDSGI